MVSHVIWNHCSERAYWIAASDWNPSQSLRLVAHNNNDNKEGRGRRGGERENAKYPITFPFALLLWPFPTPITQDRTVINFSHDVSCSPRALKKPVGKKKDIYLHLNLVFALKCSFVYFMFVFDMHYAQIKTFNASFTDKEITFLFRLNNGCKVSCGVLDSVSSCFVCSKER